MSSPQARVRPGVLVAIGLKVLLFALLAFAVTHQDWDRFAEKGTGARAIAYPLMVLVVPALWTAFGRPRGAAYPVDVDILVTLPFVIDMVGNCLDLYDRVDRFDDVCHFLNWALLSAAVGCALLRLRLPPWQVFGLCVGFGAAAAIVWEIGEYVTFVPGSAEEATAYRDTVGDETLGLSGAVVGGALSAWGAARSLRSDP